MREQPDPVGDVGEVEREQADQGLGLVGVRPEQAVAGRLEVGLLRERVALDEGELDYAALLARSA